MVRIIAGTLIRVGRGFYPPKKSTGDIEARRRTEVGVTAPPEGLVLVEIAYFFIKCYANGCFYEIR